MLTFSHVENFLHVASFFACCKFCMLPMSTCMLWNMHCHVTYMLQGATCTVHVINASLFAHSKTVKPLAAHCAAPHCAHLRSTTEPYTQHSGVRFSHKQHLHLPCTPLKNPLSGSYITKISSSTSTFLVVRTYMKNFENEHGGKWAFRTRDMVREMRGVAG